MVLEKYTFGYELKSKQVRAYLPHDLGSVRRALINNLQEYLAYEGISEEDPTSLKNLFLKVVTVACAGGTYFMSKSKVSGDLLVGSIALFAVLVAFQYACSFMQRNGDVVFVGTGHLIDDRATAQKPRFKKLKNQRLCIRLDQEDITVPVIKLEAQIIGDSKLFSPPTVYSRVEKTVQYGQFFGSTGYFFPPALIKLVDEMLDTLVAKKQK